jgi:hypothetical protein
MLDLERYRDQARACMLAALKASEPRRRLLHVSLAASWLSLANQDDASWRVTSEVSLVPDEPKLERGYGCNLEDHSNY